MSWINKRIVLFFLSLSLGYQSLGQEVQISLLTCDPGNELYSSFGHSAIRVKQEGGQDLVFNFGTFDFDTPNFYGKFTTGKLNYMLSLTTFDRFIFEYDYFQRAMREQVLDLNPTQKQEIIQQLNTLYDPANRFYKYDFFFNNCATKVRDVFETVLGKQLIWNYPSEHEEKTFRNLIDEYVFPLPWADLGIDLALGSVIDRNATEREKQYLPDYMEQAFANATIEGDGPTRPLVKESRVILDFPNNLEPYGPINPYLIFWLLAIVVGALTFWGNRTDRLFNGIDVGLFTLLGLLGVLVTFLWFFTDHSATKWNWNILWAFPGHLVLAVGLFKKSKEKWIQTYLLAVLILTVMALLIWVFGFQSFHPSLVPIFLVILLRANFRYYRLGQFQSKSY